jgi:hypothetical protein
MTGFTLPKPYTLIVHLITNQRTERLLHCSQSLCYIHSRNLRVLSFRVFNYQPGVVSPIPKS